MPTDASQCTLYVNNLNDAMHPDALQRKLVPLFHRFGKILHVVAMKSLFRRGQMFLVFANPSAASAAMLHLQGRLVFGKPLRIAFAKTPSDALLRHRGLPVDRQRKPPSSAAESQAKLKDITKTRTVLPIRSQPKNSTYTNLPNRTLFVENVPTDFTREDFVALFRDFQGFQEARLIAVRSLGFVDFDSDFHATQALDALADSQVRPGVKLHVTYAKK